jgi:hypothetical protein
MWQSHACVHNLCPSLPFDTCARVFKHKRALNQRNFVASTFAKQLKKKNSRTVLKYRQFVRNINTTTNGRLYHSVNKPFSRSVVYLVCILMFTETVLKPLKDTFYNERFVQAIKSLMQTNAAICRIQTWQRQLIVGKSKSLVILYVLKQKIIGLKTL